MCNGDFSSLFHLFNRPLPSPHMISEDEKNEMELGKCFLYKGSSYFPHRLCM